MSSISAQDVQSVVREFVAAEVECRELSDGSSRIGCVTPLQFADGDNVVVWVEQWGDRFILSDYGAAFAPVITRADRDQVDFAAIVRDYCTSLGLVISNGVLTAQTDHQDLGDAVWRVAVAARSVFERAKGFRAPRRSNSSEPKFTSEVEKVLTQHNIPVEREVALEGSSGHEHRATLYVPQTEAILEPIAADAHYNRISAVYAKFGDLRHANGYSRLALIDDRGDEPMADDFAAMLVQVSDVLRWTRRDDWMERLL